MDNFQDEVDTLKSDLSSEIQRNNEINIKNENLQMDIESLNACIKRLDNDLTKNNLEIINLTNINSSLKKDIDNLNMT